MNKAKPTISIIAAGCFWGLMSLFVRRLSDAGLSVYEIGLVRIFFAVLMMLVFILIRSPSLLKIRLRDLWLFAGTGIISLSFLNICYFTVISKGDVSVAVVLLYTSPIWVMLLSAIFFKEKITLIKLAAVVLTFSGCILISGISGNSNMPVPLFLMGLASGLCYSLYSIFGRIALKRYDTYTLTFYTFIFSFVSMLFFSDVGSLIKVTIEHPNLLLSEAGLGIICAGFPYLLYSWGLQRIETSRAAVLATIEPVVGAIIGIVIFNESCSFLRILGFALIIFSSVMLSVNIKLPWKKSKNTNEVSEIKN